VEDGVLVLRRIHVAFSLSHAAERAAEAQRAHEHYKLRCPIYRSIHRAIDVSSELVLVSENV
jgi:organic hydroperoxide reductase OsmC/OhrA